MKDSLDEGSGRVGRGGREARVPGPAVAVILVSDYAPGEEQSWEDFRRSLDAWSRQDFDGPVEFLIVESQRHEAGFPADLRDRIPGLRVRFGPQDSSYSLKNLGVELVDADLVVVADADCEPTGSWLRLLVACFRRDPEVVAVSGLTRYRGDRFRERLLGLLGRSHVDPGAAGPTRFVAGSAAGYRRSAWLEHPLPEGVGSFASLIQSEALLRAGGRFHFDPEMEMLHESEGWAMERDIRWNAGYGTVSTRLLDGRLPYAGLVRIGAVAIPAILAGKIIDCLGDILRCARHYGVRWWEMPVAFVLAVATHLFEVPGMWAAYRGHPVIDTRYR